MDSLRIIFGGVFEWISGDEEPGASVAGAMPVVAVATVPWRKWRERKYRRVVM